MEKVELNKRNQDRTYSIRYIDDGNFEDSVYPEDLLLSTAKVKLEGKDNFEKIDTLQKPLFGLIEDDSLERSAHVPTVVIHEVIETGYKIFYSSKPSMHH